MSPSSYDIEGVGVGGKEGVEGVEGGREGGSVSLSDGMDATPCLPCGNKEESGAIRRQLNSTSSSICQNRRQQSLTRDVILTRLGLA